MDAVIGAVLVTVCATFPFDSHTVRANQLDASPIFSGDASPEGPVRPCYRVADQAILADFVSNAAHCCLPARASVHFTEHSIHDYKRV